MACGLHMALWSGGAMIWWRRCSTHEEREGKAVGQRVAVAHLVVCVLCVCFVFCVLLLFGIAQKESNTNQWQSGDRWKGLLRPIDLAYLNNAKL